MRAMVTRVATAAGLAVVLVSVLAGVSAGSSSTKYLVLGSTSNNSGTKRTALTADTDSNSFVVYQTGKGSAIRGYNKANGNALYGTASNSASADALYAENIGGAASTNAGTAVLGLGNNTWGIVGNTYDAYGVAVDGEDTSNSTNGLGTQGLTGQGVGVVGSATDKTGPGVGGQFSTNSTSSSAWGLVAQGCKAVPAPNTCSPSATSQAALFQGNVEIDGNLKISGGTCTGCAIAAIAVNGSGAAIRTGQAVALLGVRPSPTGGAPVLVVGPAGAASHVVGIASGAMVARSSSVRSASVRTVGGFHRLDGASTPSSTFVEGGPSAAPGRYVLVVTYGIVAVASVDASGGAIHAGDSLCASSTPGSLARSAPISVHGRSFTVPGSSVGYALGSLPHGTGTMAVLVSPH
jgi:hypothetical protein